MNNIFKYIGFLLLLLSGNGVFASGDEGFFDFYTFDYSSDVNKNVEYIGASMYEKSSGNLQTKLSFQIAAQNEEDQSTKVFFGMAAAGRYRFDSPIAPFAGIGFFYGQTDVCDDEPEDDEEACIEDNIFAGFTEYGISWLIADQFFIEASRKHNHTSKSEPFDSVVNGFSIGFRY